MDNAGLISVIIPVYNVEKYLRQCVDSVLNQTYTSIEIILVDDGSTDRSGEICEEYAAQDGRVRCLHQENGGASKARNAGLDIAVGEYVFFLDSDDWLHKGAFCMLAERMADDSVDFAFCEGCVIEEKTGNIRYKNYSYHRDYGTGSSREFFYEMTAHNEFHVVVWLILFRKSFLAEKSLRFIEGIMYEDCVFTYQTYCWAEKASHVHEILYYRRWRRDSVMTTPRTGYSFNSSIRAYKEIAAFWEASGAAYEAKPYLARIAFNVISNYDKLSCREKRAYRDIFADFRSDVEAKDAFDDVRLRKRCRSKAAWAAYKLRTKLLHG